MQNARLASGTSKLIAEALIGPLRAHPIACRLTIRFDHKVDKFSLSAGRINGATVGPIWITTTYEASAQV